MKSNSSIIDKDVLYKDGIYAYVHSFLFLNSAVPPCSVFLGPSLSLL